MKTFLILYLVSHVRVFVSHVRVFVSDNDLSDLDGLSLTTSAQPTKALEEKQDRLFSEFYRYDDAANMNVPKLRELAEFEGLPEPANEKYKVIRILP